MAPLRAVALLAFASHAAAQLAGGATGGGGVNCCGGGGSCGFEHCPLLGAGEEGCVQPWNMPNGLSFDDCNQGGGGGSCTPEDIDAMMSTDPESSQAELDAAMEAKREELTKNSEPTGLLKQIQRRLVAISELIDEQ